MVRGNFPGTRIGEKAFFRTVSSVDSIRFGDMFAFTDMHALSFTHAADLLPDEMSIIGESFLTLARISTQVKVLTETRRNCH